MTDRFVTVPDSLELPAAVKVGVDRLHDSTVAGRALLTGADAAAQRSSLGLGTAATTDAGDFATAAQGALADSAVQPGDLGTAAVADAGDFATAAQGALADSAVQPGDLATRQAASLLYTPGVSGSHVEAPSAAGDITGDLDIRWYGALDSYGTTAANKTLVAKFSPAAALRAWWFYVTTDGKLRFNWYPSDTAAYLLTASKLSIPNGTFTWLRATLDVDNGAGGYTANLYTSPDGVNWTVVATKTEAGVTSIRSTSARVTIGSDDYTAAQAPSAGYHRYVEVRSGIGGPVVSSWDGGAGRHTTQTDAQGNVWTVAGSVTWRRLDGTTEAPEVELRPPGSDWESGVGYSAGDIVRTELGHEMYALSDHTSAVRFCDDMALWRSVTPPPREALLLATAKAGRSWGIGVGDKPVIALRFDDYHDIFRATVVPLLTARGLPAGHASISNLTAQPWAAGTTPADVLAYHKQGIEIWSHGLDHNDPTPGDLTGLRGLRDQIIGSKTTIESWGVECQGWMQPGATPVIEGVVPYGGTDEWPHLDQYAYWLVRNTYPLSEADVWGRLGRPIPAPFYHGAAHITPSDGTTYNTFAKVQPFIDAAVAAKQGLVMMFHSGSLGNAGKMAWGDFEAVLDYVVSLWNAGTIEVLTPSGLMHATTGTDRADLIRSGSGTFESVTSGDNTWTQWTGWTVTSGGGHSGDKFVRSTNTVATTLFQASGALGLLAGKTFVFEGWARSNGAGTTDAFVEIKHYLPAPAGTLLDLTFTTTDIGADWTRIRHAFSIPPGITSIQTHLGRAAGDGIDWDDISVKQV